MYLLVSMRTHTACIDNVTLFRDRDMSKDVYVTYRYSHVLIYLHINIFL